jgi:hypothetical protein
MRCRYGWMPCCCPSFMPRCWVVRAGALMLLCASTLLAAVASAVPKVIVISLDGATPRLVDQHTASGALSPNQGLGLLQSKGMRAEQNTTVAPSLTAPGHIAIATGSTAARNEIIANTFHLVASPFNTNISGFSAPIGGYELTSHGPVESSTPTTGPAYVHARSGKSSPFFLEGSSNKAGLAFYVTRLAPDLATVRLARSSANAIPRNPAVLADVDDINTHVGFWAPQPDFRIPERLSPGFTTFPDRRAMGRVVDLLWDRLMRRWTDNEAQAGPKKKVSVRGSTAKRTRSKQP